MRIAITVNGKSAQADDTDVVADLLHELGIETDAEGVAMAVNDAVIPRHEWASRRVRAGDKIEIIRAVQGG
ncbi:MAG TPA: sulfur carrier protein ThiS [Candidatus Krumholzibacteria bacterium]|nr:sulfur carrier protein ThiS [Candidatus Krumholzibacteria bacterium]